MAESPPAQPEPQASDQPAPSEQPEPNTFGRHVKRRPLLVWVLILLAALIGFVAILTTWVNRQMLDTNSWTKSSSALLQDPQIRQSLSVYLVNQIYDNVDVQAELQQRLPPALQGLAGPIAGGLRQPAVDAVDKLLARPRVQALWTQTNRIAHERFVAVVENKTRPGISTANGNVTLDLRTMLLNLAQQLGLPGVVLSKLPPDAGQITVLKSNQLSAAQTSVRAIKALSVWLIVLVFILWALALWFAAGTRRLALRNIGWSIFVVGALLLIIQKAAGHYLVHSLTTATSRPAGNKVWLIATGILRDIGWAGVAYGILIVLGAVLAGPTRVGTAVRSWLAPVLNQKQILAWCIVAFIYLLVIVWAPTHALTTPVGILLFAALIAAGVYALRRETMREFPAGSMPQGAAMASSAGAALMARRPGRGSGEDSVAAELERLQGLRESGAISEDEFQKAKEKALS